MTGRLTYRIIGEPQRQSYEALIRYCAAEGAFGTLVDQFWTTKAGKAARASFLARAGPYLKAVEIVERWPLNEPQSGCAGRPVPLWRFDLTDEMIGLLVECPRGLYGWLNPKLPEDLAVYRIDGSVLLGTVAHEHIGWMNLTSKEASDVRLNQVQLELECH